MFKYILFIQIVSKKAIFCIRYNDRSVNKFLNKSVKPYQKNNVIQYNARFVIMSQVRAAKTLQNKIVDK